MYALVKVPKIEPGNKDSHASALLRVASENL